tara:strand:- start:186 stop:389 length:204 start_codon:yes stop_codon:yes gene_type:complete
MEGTVTVNGIDVDFEVISYEDCEYRITAIRCEEGLDESIYLDSFYDKINDWVAEEVGEGMAIRRGLC